VLHASLQGVENLANSEHWEADGTVNASSNLQMSEEEVTMLNAALSESDGSFETLFEKYGDTSDTSESDE